MRQATRYAGCFFAFLLVAFLLTLLFGFCFFASVAFLLENSVAFLLHIAFLLGKMFCFFAFLLFGLQSAIAFLRFCFLAKKAKKQNEQKSNQFEKAKKQPVSEQKSNKTFRPIPTQSLNPNP